MDLHEQLKEIKTQLRLSMNGVASQSMREKGLNYKLNFGVELPRIKAIAAQFEQEHSLAQALWKENIRECKILATMLQPADSLLPEIADIWIDAIPTIEIAEYLCMNLLQFTLCALVRFPLNSRRTSLCTSVRLSYYSSFVAKEGRYE